MTDPLRDVLNSVCSDAQRYALMATTMRELNPKKLTTVEVQAVFDAVAMFFDRAGKNSLTSAVSIAKVLEQSEYWESSGGDADSEVG